MTHDGSTSTDGQDEELATVHSLPQRPSVQDGLTPRQRKILDTIRTSILERGYPPSMREIGAVVGLVSPSSVKHQLTALERKGYLRRDPNRPRAIEVIQPDDARALRPRGFDQPDYGLEHLSPGDEAPEPAYAPLVGRIAAGGPVLADQHVEDVFPLPRQLVGDGELFHKVTGTHDRRGDLRRRPVVVRSQPTAKRQIVARCDGRRRSDSLPTGACGSACEPA